MSRRWWGGALRRLLASEQELSAERLREAARRSGATAIEALQPGERATVVGHITSVIIRPRRAVTALEAEVFDGSGMLRVVWLGRRAVGGIEAGRPITVSGRVVIGSDQQPTIFNPRYELHAGVAR